MISLRCVRADDVRAYTGEDISPECATIPPFGWVAERDGQMVAIGFVVWDLWGRAWGCFDRRRGPGGWHYVSAPTMHRLAQQTIEGLRDVGEPALYAECSPTLPGAARWLARLGFEYDPALSANHRLQVWKCNLST